MTEHGNELCGEEGMGKAEQRMRMGDKGEISTTLYDSFTRANVYFAAKTMKCNSSKNYLT
jgi:hypothetical protein